MHGRGRVVPVAGPVARVAGVAAHALGVAHVPAPRPAPAPVPAPVSEAVLPAPASVALLVAELAAPAEGGLAGQTLGLHEVALGEGAGGQGGRVASVPLQPQPVQPLAVPLRGPAVLQLLAQHLRVAVAAVAAVAGLRPPVRLSPVTSLHGEHLTSAASDRRPTLALARTPRPPPHGHLRQPPPGGGGSQGARVGDLSVLRRGLAVAGGRALVHALGRDVSLDPVVGRRRAGAAETVPCRQSRHRGH